MLGKMIKYDLKANTKVFLLIHGAYLLLCLIGRFFYVNRLNFGADPEQLIISISLFISLVSFLIAAVNLCTWLQIAFRFYRNLFSREGYLTWALPISAIRHLWAKIISGYILMILDTVFIFAGLILLVTGKNVTDAYSAIAPEVHAEFGISLTQFAFYMFLLCILSGFCTTITTYFCVTAGQLFSSHRILFAFVTYLVTSFVVEVFSLVILGIYNFFPGRTFILTGADLASYILDILIITISLMAVITILEYIATHYIMTKKINLL